MLFFCSGSSPKPLCCTTIPSPVSKHCLVLPASLSQILLFANYWVRYLTISVLIKLLPISFVRFEGAPVCFSEGAPVRFFFVPSRTRTSAFTWCYHQGELVLLGHFVCFAALFLMDHSRFFKLYSRSRHRKARIFQAVHHPDGANVRRGNGLLAHHDSRCPPLEALGRINNLARLRCRPPSRSNRHE